MLLIGNFISNVRGDYLSNPFMAEDLMQTVNHQAFLQLVRSWSDRYSSAFISCLQYEAA